MKDNFAGAVWRFAVFGVVCLLGIFALLAIFGQLRFDKENVYRAEFSNITGLKSGDFVRIAGVEVGKVRTITLMPDTTLSVEFGTDRSVVLTEGSKAAIRYDNLIGGRYLGLEEGVGGTDVLQPGLHHPAEPHRAGARSGCLDRWLPSAVSRVESGPGQCALPAN